MPTKLALAIEWEELRHPFNLESVVKPLRLGVPVTEIPSVWHPRIEGESHTCSFAILNIFDWFESPFCTEGDVSSSCCEKVPTATIMKKVIVTTTINPPTKATWPFRQ